MWKRGVVSKGQFANWALARERAHRGWWPFAYTILADLETSYRPCDEPLLQRLYESMAAGERIFKITRRNRFPEVDAMIARSIGKDTSQQIPSVHDVGASNGITSLELFERLSRVCEVRVHATDYYDHIYLVAFGSGRWTVVFDSDRRPLQFVGKAFVLSGRNSAPLRYPVNRIMELWVRCRVLPQAAAILETALAGDASVAYDRPGPVRRVSLFHPECLATARRNPRFTIGRFNVFEPSERQDDVLRAMNVISPSHMDCAEIERAIRCCVTGVRAGGLFVIGRTIDEEDSRPRTTGFRWHGARLLPEWDLYGGAEVKDLVASLEFA